jgi:hypothetical protein
MVLEDDIKQRFQEDDLQAITGGNDSVISRAINSAKIWLFAALNSRGLKLDEEDEVQREIIIKRTLYELYAYSQDWEIAKANREESEQMLLAMFGEVGESRPLAPVVKVAKGQSDWHGFK